MTQPEPVTWIAKAPEDMTPDELYMALYHEPAPTLPAGRANWPIFRAIVGSVLFFIAVCAVVLAVGCAVAAV